MTNELQIFNYAEEHQIRTTVIDGEAWFVGKDVACALGYGNTRDALKAHVDEGDRRVSRITTPSNGGEQDMRVCQVNCVLDFSYATWGNLSAYLT